MKRAALAVSVATVLTLASACASGKRPVAPGAPPPSNATLWRAPSDIASQDLFYGPWGPSRAPNPDATYTLVKHKRNGVNPGLTVRDPQGREWSVKQAYPGGLDAEGPVEVVLSRLLSAIGYHQPPVYFLPAFTLKDEWGTHVEVGGRFRLDAEELKEAGSWLWEANPFVGTRPYQGLLTLMMLFNNTDIKGSNNALYEYRNGGGVERWYVAKDIGASLGDTDRWAPRKNHLISFERSPFITGVANGHVEFAYNGWYRDYVRDHIAPADVVWVTDLLAQLTERQWQDAFRAGGYEPAEAAGFIRALRRKVAEGQALRRALATTSAVPRPPSQR